jgi:hypothetical protein
VPLKKFSLGRENEYKCGFWGPPRGLVSVLLDSGPMVKLVFFGLVAWGRSENLQYYRQIPEKARNNKLLRKKTLHNCEIEGISSAKI